MAYTPVMLVNGARQTGKTTLVKQIGESSGASYITLDDADTAVNGSDFAGLHALREAAGRKFIRGTVLYDGDAALPFGEDLFAAPISALWSPM